jgi:hypothetical protein
MSQVTQSPGRKDPNTLPVVPSNSQRAVGAAVSAVANAPLAVFTYSSGGRGKI